MFYEIWNIVNIMIALVNGLKDSSKIFIIALIVKKYWENIS